MTRYIYPPAYCDGYDDGSSGSPPDFSRWDDGDYIEGYNQGAYDRRTDAENEKIERINCTLATSLERDN